MPPNAHSAEPDRVDVGGHASVGAIGDYANVFQFLLASPPTLAEHMRVDEFRTLVDERTKRFVGREYVFAAIDDLLERDAFPSGYIVIRGEPGIGKTALMGMLVRRGGFVHHFNIGPQNIRKARDFLGNVCAQLIAHYDLPYDALPSSALDDSGFLSRLLNQVPRDQPVVVVVDALDEAEDEALPPTANRLFLPPSLPQGVFFVVSTRPKTDDRLAVDRPETIDLEERDPANIDDVTAYVRIFIKDNADALSPRIAGTFVDEDAFVERVVELSEGNFMYIVHVLPDIAVGRLDISTEAAVRSLPQGLRGYYRRHWREMEARMGDRFTREQRPIVCTLAALHEPVSLPRLVDLTGLEEPVVRSVIDDWYEFLNDDTDPDGKHLYRIYHASFQDFLREDVGLTEAHARVGRAGAAKIPGLPSS